MQNKTRILGALIASLLLAGGAAWLYGQQSQTSPLAPQQAPVQRTVKQPAATHPQPTAITPTIGTPVATPNLITVYTPTTVTVTVSITPAPIPNGVNLLRLGATGTQPTILGVMQNAGNGTYTLRVPFNEQAAGSIQLQVSAAFSGQLKRYSSLLLIIPIWNALVDNTLGLSVTYPPTYTESKLTAGPLIDSTGATAAVALGTTIAPDGTTDSGIMLYVYALGVTDQADEPGPPFDTSQCKTIQLSNASYTGQLCTQMLDSDALDGPVYRQELTVSTQRFNYRFVATSNSETDPTVSLFQQIISSIHLY